MQRIEALFQQLNEQQSTELLLSPFTQARFRSNKGWSFLSEEILNPSEVKETLWSLLNELQREELAEKGLVSGSVGTTRGLNINFSILKHKLGYSGLLKLIKSELPESEKNLFPTVLVEQSLKSRGLILVAGPAKSGRSTFISHLVDRRNQEMSSYITILESAVQFIHQPVKSVIAQIEVGTEKCQMNLGQIADSDAVFIDQVQGVENLEKAIELAEAGKLVVLNLNIDSFSGLIKRLESNYHKDSRDSILFRLAEVLLTFVNCRLLTGVQEKHVVAQEIYIFNAAMKESLKKGDLASLQQYVSEFGEKVGMRTLNQSIAALAVRRKVDLKQAFLSTYDPEGLDLLFSKMGV